MASISTKDRHIMREALLLLKRTLVDELHRNQTQRPRNGKSAATLRDHGIETALQNRIDDIDTILHTHVAVVEETLEKGKIHQQGQKQTPMNNAIENATTGTNHEPPNSLPNRPPTPHNVRPSNTIKVDTSKSGEQHKFANHTAQGTSSRRNIPPLVLRRPTTIAQENSTANSAFFEKDISPLPVKGILKSSSSSSGTVSQRYNPPSAARNLNSGSLAIQQQMEADALLARQLAEIDRTEHERVEHDLITARELAHGSPQVLHSYEDEFIEARYHVPYRMEEEVQHAGWFDGGMVVHQLPYEDERAIFLNDPEYQQSIVQNYRDMLERQHEEEFHGNRYRNRSSHVQPARLPAASGPHGHQSRPVTSTETRRPNPTPMRQLGRASNLDHDAQERHSRTIQRNPNSPQLRTRSQSRSIRQEQNTQQSDKKKGPVKSASGEVDGQGPTKLPASDCAACGESANSNSMCQLSCEHSYCRACLTQSITHALADKKVFQCCKTRAAPAHITAFLPADILSRYNTLVQELDTTDPIYCSYRGCSTFIPPSKIQGDRAICPKCTKTTCKQCKAPAHGGVCKADKAGMALLELGKKKNWKACPHCKNLVERINGCLHMVCRCGRDFCYNCGEPSSKCSGNCRRPAPGRA